MRISSIPSRMFNGVKNSLWKLENPGKMLMHTGALGWAMGSAAQITGIMVNDKIDAQKKKFLVPQETFDALGNIGLYYAVTVTFMHFTKRLFDYGRLRFDKVEKQLHLAAWKECKQEKAALRKAYRKAKKELAKNPLDKEKKQLYGAAKRELKRLEPNKTRIANKVKEYFAKYKTMSKVLEEKVDKNTLDYFLSRQKGAGILAALVASVISSNILTPYFRNYVASKKQEKAIEIHKTATTTLFALQMQKDNRVTNSSKFSEFIV